MHTGTVLETNDIDTVVAARAGDTRELVHRFPLPVFRLFRFRAPR